MNPDDENENSTRRKTDATKRPEGLTPREQLERKIDAKQRRKIKARREGQQSPWFGLGMFGLVGWSVAIPTLFGVALGTWIDHRWPSRVSWTLTLLFLGVVMGFMNAWHWMHKETETNNDESS